MELEITGDIHLEDEAVERLFKESECSLRVGIQYGKCKPQEVEVENVHVVEEDGAYWVVMSEVDKERVWRFLLKYL